MGQSSGESELRSREEYVFEQDKRARELRNKT